ncbi:MAG: oxidoreductase [Gammaproteobacteria bacterium]|nr:oxidoreductase [Gammaproteobacteria bacterium]
MKDTSVALVTGASSGIGEAIARQLLADGFVVYAAARRLDRMAELKGHGVIPVRMDVTRDEDVAGVVDVIRQEHGGVDVLVNNAGFGSYGAMEDTSLEDAKYQFDVNLFGVARVTRAVLPYMREVRSGCIVNISSMGGKVYTPLGSWYHASKHALEGWSDCLRLELAPFGIQVVIIEPGIIETEFGASLLGPMMERSGNSAYSEMAKVVASATEKFYGQGNGSPPAVVAKAVSRAVNARRPKTRYVMGKLAGPLIFIRKWCGDRMYDKAVMRQT